MTQLVRIVIVMKIKWTYEEIKKTFDRLLPPLDPDNPKQRKRLRIIQSATTHFVKHGYRKANMSEIAQTAGVAKGTLYLYFKTKAELLVNAIGEEKRRYMTSLMPIFNEEVPPKERLRRWLRTVLVLANQMPLLSKLMSGDHEIFTVLDEMNADMRDGSLEMQHGFLTEMLDLAARPHRWTPSELQDRTKVLFGLLYSAGVFAEERARGGLSLERFAEILADLLVDGMSGSHPGSTQPSAPEQGDTP